MDKKRTIVVALGGNALQRQGEAASEQQQRVADETVRQLLPLIQAGHNVAIVHGNGPQVGNIVLHEEAINTADVPSLPLEDSGAMSQGLIGFWLQQAFHDAFAVNQMNNRAISVVTQTIVDLSDPAFQNPTKPIGPFYSEEEAKTVASERGYTVKEDAGRGWRKGWLHQNQSTSKKSTASAPCSIMVKLSSQQVEEVSLLSKMKTVT